MQIRRLRPSDAAPFHALRLAALQAAPSAFGSSFEEERDLSPEAVAARLEAQPDRGAFGAFVDGELVGLVALGRERQRKLAHKALIWGLYVQPSARGAGVARALLDEALRVARAVPDVLQVNLSVNASNQAAIRLYESLGFQAYGRETDALQVDGLLHDELHYSLRLTNNQALIPTPRTTQET